MKNTYVFNHLAVIYYFMAIRLFYSVYIGQLKIARQLERSLIRRGSRAVTKNIKKHQNPTVIIITKRFIY